MSPGKGGGMCRSVSTQGLGTSPKGATWGCDTQLLHALTLSPGDGPLAASSGPHPASSGARCTPSHLWHGRVLY